MKWFAWFVETYLLSALVLSIALVLIDSVLLLKRN